MFEQNCRFNNDHLFQNDLKDIPWDNILAFDLFFAKLNTLLDKHAPNLKKKQTSQQNSIIRIILKTLKKC